MNFDGNFRSRGTIDLSGLRTIVAGFTEEQWNADAFRQNRFEVHGDTQTIGVVFDEDFRHMDGTRHPIFYELESALQPLILKISGQFDYQGWMVRCIITRLRPGGRIGAHCDQGFSLMNAHRCHVPIVTNTGVLFTVGSETIHMNAGEIWEINNQRLHSVINNGTEPRVHVILDWAEPMTHAQLRVYGTDRRQHWERVQLGIRPKYD